MIICQRVRAVLPSLALRLLYCSGFLLLSALLSLSHAQITLDGSLGPRGPLTGPNYAIPAAIGQIRGPNLFHSFGQFNLLQGESATFTGPSTITNVLGRVTGGNPSNINGIIRSQLPGANLYLLNPAGMMFGPHASLDVRGSFHVSTADYLRLADGARFFARLSENSTLSVAPPAAFGFLGPQPAAITVQGSTLQVSEGATLSVVGGDVHMVGGTLRAPSGRIQLASVAAGGEVLPVLSEPAPDLQVDSVARLGRIDLSQRARVDASGNGGGAVLIRGGRLLVDSATIAADNRGNLDGAGLGLDLRITADALITNSALTTDSLGGGRARDLRLTAGSVRLEHGAQISSNTSGPGQGGTVRVTASDTLTLAGTSPDGRFSSGLFATARGTGVSAGNAGSVVVEAPRVTLSGGAQISSETTGPGQGGTVQVTASDTLTLAGTSPDGGSPSGLFARTRGTGAGAGNADSVVVKAPHVTLSGGARISSDTFGPGQGGTVQVTASDTLTLAGTSLNGGFRSGLFAATEGTGTAGSVVVEAPHVTLTEGARISSSTFGPGQGGTVQVTASDTLTLVGRSPDGRFSSGLFATANGTGVSAGNAGSVVVEAPRVTLSGGAEISSTTSGPGQGGTVTVTTAEALTITGRDSGLRTATAGSGPGGAIAIQARQVQLTGGAIISAESTGTGDAGNVTLTTQDHVLINQGSVVTRATQADGGNIQITAPTLVRLRDSAITAEVGGGASTVGGNITIDPQFVLLQNSQIVANALAGRGGNIRIIAQQVFLADPASRVSASSALGINGQVAIQAPVTSISGAVAPLPQSFAQTAELLRDRCVERLRGGTVSRFVFGGRDGVPLEPGSLLLSPLVQGEQPSPAPITDTVEGQREASFVRVGGLEMPNTGYLYLRGTHAQARWPGALDVECTKWREQ